MKDIEKGFEEKSLSEDEKFVKVEIEDRGPGIPDDLKKTILTKLEDKKERQKTA